MSQVELGNVVFGLKENISNAFIEAATGAAFNIFAAGIENIFFSEETVIDPFKNARVTGLSATQEIDPPVSFYNFPIPIVYGLSRITTNLIWHSEYTRKQVEQEIIIGSDVDGTGRKVNGAVLTEQKQIVKVSRDYVDFAVLMCAGKIEGVRRIWFNHVLVYNADKWGNSRPAYKGQQLNIEIFDGSDDQLPSETILAKNPDAPAYRGRAYLVFKNIDVTELGGFIPVIQVEVLGVRSGNQVFSFTNYPPESQVIFKETKGLPVEGDGDLTRFTTITESIREDGQLNPLQFSSQTMLPQSFLIIKDIIKRIGIDDSLFDFSQMSKKITGIVASDAGPIRPIIEALIKYNDGVISESDGKLKLLANPRKYDDGKNAQDILISKDGLTVNSLHDIDGRDGYFSSSGGTSEGQFVSINAFALAHIATGVQAWKDKALSLAASLENFLYGKAVPATPELFIPHWLYNAKRPIQEENSILSYVVNADDKGSYLECEITEYYDEIKRIDRAYRKSASFIWDNREAALINFSYLASKRAVELIFRTRTPEKGTGFFSSDKFDVSTKFVNYDTYAKKTFLIDAELSIKSIEKTINKWIVQVWKPSDYSIETDSEIVLAFTVVKHGKIINVGDRYEAWPNWRKLEKGEIDAAGDSLGWANDAYRNLYAITSDVKWQNAYEANKFSIQKTHDIDDGRQIFKPEPGVKTAFNQPGTFSRSELLSFSADRWTRDENGYIYAFPYIIGIYELQIGRGVNDFWRSPTDTMRIDIKRGNNNDKGNYFDYVFIDTDFVFSESTRYYAAMPANFVVDEFETYEFLHSDFMTVFDLTNPTKQLAADATIKNVGVSMFSGSERITIKLLRPMPEITLPYVPYAAMYTVNVVNNNVVNWRGVPGAGYTFPHVWHDMGIDAGMVVQIDFLKEAQNQYNLAKSINGPFIPAHYWDREDARVFGSVDSWGWNWVDPNSQWGGYQYRALQSIAKAAMETSNTDAVLVSTNFLTYLNNNWTDFNKFPPTDYPENLTGWQPTTTYQTAAFNSDIDIILPSVVNGFVYKPLNTGVSGSSEPAWPTTLYQTVTDGGITWECSGYQYGAAYGNYNEPHMVSLIMRAAIYMRLGGFATTICDSLILRCYNYLNLNYVSSGNMQGTWSSGTDWWMFWHSEIIQTLSELLIDGGAIITNLGLSSTLINQWLSESLTFIDNHTDS